MKEIAIGACAVLAYLLGSIPTAVWYGQALFNIDIRQFGSGNAGATNTFRVLGRRAGFSVLLVDMLKGYTAASLPLLLNYISVLPQAEILPWQLAFGALAIIGHLYPVFAEFKGGKGVATLLGMVLAIHPSIALICTVLFLIILLVFQYVSLASMLSAIAFPILLVLRAFGEKESPLFIGFGFLMALLVVVTHRKNIVRLWRGEENRTILIGSRKKPTLPNH